MSTATLLEKLLTRYELPDSLEIANENDGGPKKNVSGLNKRNVVPNNWRNYFARKELIGKI